MMSEEKQLNLSQQKQPASTGGQAEVEMMTLRPLADIKETTEGVSVYLDMPGVAKDALNIDVDKNLLSIRGAINLHTPEELKPSYMELHSGVFERQFTLGDELDSDNINATLKQGELIVFIPRSEKHKPRKVEIKVN
jgi:HSP20 family molecular chaperone IbpA